MPSFVSYRQSVFLSTLFGYYSLLQFGGERGGAKREGLLLERSAQGGGVKIPISPGTEGRYGTSRQHPPAVRGMPDSENPVFLALQAICE